jgi:hypothetical protein
MAKPDRTASLLHPLPQPEATEARGSIF